MFSQDLPVFKCCILLNDKFQARVIPHFLGAIAGFLAQDWLSSFHRSSATTLWRPSLSERFSVPHPCGSDSRRVT